MWEYNGKVIRVGRSWKTTDGITHPTNWNNWSDAEKVANGLVWEDEPESFDGRFYLSVGNPIALDELKSEYKAQTKITAGYLLAPTDWYVIRKTEDSTTTIPTDVATYRAAVRTASGTIETAIDNAADLDAFIALFDTPVDSDGDPTGKAPINDFPDKI